MSYTYAQTLLIVCPLVFFAGFVDAVAGGGGLISTPAFLAAKIPPAHVLGCNKFSAVFGTTTSLIRFIKSGNIHKPIAAVSVAAALFGSWCGASLALYLSDEILKAMMLFLLPAVLLFILLKKDLGEKKELLSTRRLLTYSIIISFAIGGYDGFFGPGTGTFLILAFTSLLGYDVLTASGNAKAVNTASNVAALAVFIANGKVLFPIAIPAAVCSILGGYIGSGLAISNGLKVIKPFFVVVILLLMGKILFDIYYSYIL